MFCILINPEHQLPTVISKNDNSYPDLIMAGWEEISSGHKRDMEEEAEEMLQEIYQYN